MSLSFREAGWVALTEWVESRSPTRLFSDFGWGEIVSSVGRKVRMKELAPDDGRIWLAQIGNRLGSWSRLVTTGAEIDAAAAMIADFTLGLRLPDAIHIAIARHHDATLITTDHRQGDAAAALNIRYIDPTRPS